MKGKLFLLPVTLGGDNPQMVIPSGVIETTRNLRFFIVEELRTARRYLRLLDKSFPIDDSKFFILNEHTLSDEIASFLEPAENGSNIGLMSEAGLPCLADPGARIVSLAHTMGIKIVPLAGPSSIILALISSGMNGQNFTFNGYLPVKPAERTSKIKDIEKRAREGTAQIFMETPYRNNKLFDSLIEQCSGERLLCIATDITLQTEYISVMTISNWKRNKPELNDKLTVFVLQ